MYLTEEEKRVLNEEVGFGALKNRLTYDSVWNQLDNSLLKEQTELLEKLWPVKETSNTDK